MRSIQPLGEQIIIKTIPMADRLGSIIIPDQAKGKTMMGEKGPDDMVHYVEAEVIAVGPGKRGVDATLQRDAAAWLAGSAFHIGDALKLLRRLIDPVRVPLSVKPGDRIVYHPSVAKFDRKVEGLGEGEFFIILENSVLAVIE